MKIFKTCFSSVFFLAMFLLLVPALSVNAKKELNYEPLCMTCGSAAKQTVDKQPTCTKSGKYVYRCKTTDYKYNKKKKKWKKCPNYDKVVLEGTWGKLGHKWTYKVKGKNKKKATHIQTCQRCTKTGKGSHKASWKVYKSGERTDKKHGYHKYCIYRCKHKNCKLTYTEIDDDWG